MELYHMQGVTLQIIWGMRNDFQIVSNSIPANFLVVMKIHQLSEKQPISKGSHVVN